MGLQEYRKKRDFSKTEEPYGEKVAGHHQLKFVVQKHAASHLHYDFRLEMQGVLKSWAVPKGPSLNPAVKRLAVQVEDHPLDYSSFEGIIPEHEYGGGTVMVWDQGTWLAEGDVLASYKKGKLVFTLMGSKLKGKWELIRMQDSRNWLLMKFKDSEAHTEIEITKTAPNSVLTNRSLEEIKQAGSKKTAKSVKACTLSPGAMPKLAKKAPFPSTITPQLATLTDKIPPGDQWLHEIKYDGYRLIAMINGKDIKLMTRNKHDWTTKFEFLSKELRQLKLKSAIFDGELVALDESGLSDFQALQNSIKESAPATLVYYVFDLLYYQGYSLLEVPLLARKKLLATVIPNDQFLRYSEHIAGEGAQVLKSACHLALEGVVSKDKTAPYLQKRSHAWYKTKCKKEQEFVIGGYIKAAGNRQYFRSLLLGYYNDQQQLQYCGRVGTGFTLSSLKEIYTLLKKNAQDSCPFINKPTADLKLTCWLKPKLVAQIEYAALTKEKVLRHAAFKGLRADKKTSEVVLELPKPMESNKMQETQAIKPVKKTTKLLNITHPDKILFPDSSITKQMLADYYEQIAPWLLPFTMKRPLTLVRCPDGANKTCFFQKHTHEDLPHLYKISIAEKTKTADYVYIKNTAGLISLVQLGVLEIHAWGCHIDKIEKPDCIIFDLDPGPGVAWDRVVQGAQLIHDYLAELKLKSFVKTSGGKGLHIAVPIKRNLSWEDFKAFTQAFAKTLAQTYPKLFIATMTKAKREGKIFIDYFRNNRGSTTVVPFSTRAKPHAPISTPIFWEELTKVSPALFTLENIYSRLEKLKEDPWEEFFHLKQKLII